MGFGQSKVDYTERNFTEQPLEDEEIDILLKALPKKNVIKSIDSSGKEEILKTMSDEKVFNLRGDKIFDYYFTNKREIIKGCMEKHIYDEGEDCDEPHMNNMFETVPNFVKDTGGEFVHVKGGKPDLSVNEQECKTYMESKGYGFKQLDYAGAVSGCFYAENLPFEPIKGFYNIKSTEGKCSADLPEGVEDTHNISCVQKK